jgi:Secretion system C-terminal sorting domain
MKKISLLMLAILGIALGAQAQNATAILNIGNFSAPIRSDGQLFQDGSYILPGLEWPKTSVVADKRYISYTGQLWMAATDPNGTLRVAANTYGQTGRGYFPGRSGFDPVAYDQAWKITKAEITQFQTDFANGTVNFANYPVIQTWPAFGTDLQGNVKPYAPFVDVDGNPATYNPAAGDYPDVPGDEAVFFGFTDDPGTLVSEFPNNLSFDVLGFAYAYSCPQLEDVLFLQYDVINATARGYTDLKIGLWQDNDLGNYADDYVGSDTTSDRPMIYTFNGDANDETAQGYGLTPPAIGTTLLSEPASNGMYYENNFTIVGNPNTPAYFAGYLASTWGDGSHLTHGGSGYATSGVNANFPFTGDPGFCSATQSGWHAAGAGMTPQDARTILATAPSTLLAGETKRLTFAMLMARDYTNQNLSSVCKLMTMQDSLSSWMNSAQMPCAGVATGVKAPRDIAATLAPNPTHATSMIRFENAGNEIASAQVIDLQGRQVAATVSGTGTQLLLQTEGLAQGLYLVKLHCGDKQTVLRLQKD